MIKTLISIRLKLLTHHLKDVGIVLINIIAIFTTLIYGGLYSLLSKLIINGNTEFISLNEFNIFVNTLIVVFFIFFKVFPNYSSLKKEFPSYYPISIFVKYLYSLVVYFFTPLILLITLFYMCIWLLGAENEYILKSFILIVNVIFIFRNIQYLIDFKNNLLSYLLTIIIVFLIFFLKDNFYWCLILLSFLDGYYKESITENYSFVVQNNNYHFPFFITILIKNKTRLNTILVAFFMKSLLITINIVLYRKTGKYFGDSEALLWVILSPIFIFNYLHNNFLMFFKDLLFRSYLSNGQFNHIIQIGSRLLIFPLFIDLSLTLLAILFFKINLVKISSFYLFSLILAYSSSFFWSITMPLSIKRVFQLNGTTSKVASLFLIISTFLIYYLTKTTSLYLLVVIIVLIGGLILTISKTMYKKGKYKLLSK